MNDSDFAVEVDKIINKIAQTIEDNDPECKYDIDLNDGILTFTNESGTYVINRQSVAKEIWLSSPVSGPYHFALQEARWKSRTGAELYQILTDELNIKIEG
jgi:CyaY protein